MEATFIDHSTEDGGSLREFLDTSAPRPRGARAPDDDLPCAAGLNRLAWDLTYHPYATSPRATAPLSAPGEHRIELDAGGVTSTARVVVASDPRVGADRHDLQEQTELLLAIREVVAELMGAIEQTRKRREQADAPSDSLDEIERALHRVVLPGDLARNHPGGILDGLQRGAPVIVSADAATTRQARKLFDRWQRQAHVALARLEQVLRAYSPQAASVAQRCSL